MYRSWHWQWQLSEVLTEKAFVMETQIWFLTVPRGPVHKVSDRGPPPLPFVGPPLTDSWILFMKTVNLGQDHIAP